MTIKGLIFDFDGLILDTEAPLYRAWNEIYSGYSISLPLDQYASCIGSNFDSFDPAQYLVELSNQNLNQVELHQQAKSRGLELLVMEGLRDGFPRILEEARNACLKLAVASSSTRSWVTSNLQKRSLLNYFHCIRTADDVDRVKPEPDLYLSALEGLGISAEEAIAFEDSQHGVFSAYSAGIKVVAVPNELTQSMNFSLAALVLPSLADISIQELIQQVTTS
jgi:putative hydrolase of the HAD superfamily